MIVVAIIGILAAVAIPGFMQYIKSSKTSEAKENLKTIADGAIAYFEAEHCYDDDCMQPTNQLYPGVPSGGKYAVASDVKVPNAAKIGQKQSPAATAVTSVLGANPYLALKFSINKPFYYGYAYTSAGTDPGKSTFVAAAEASLNATADSAFFIQGTAQGKVGNIIDKSEFTGTAPTGVSFGSISQGK